MAQKSMKSRSGRMLALAALVLLFAGVASIAKMVDSKVMSYLIAFAFALIFIAAYLRFSKEEDLLADERTEKTKRIATSYSWWLTYVLIAGMMIADEFKLASLTVGGALGLTFFFMVASQHFLGWHFGRKADVG